MIGQGCWGWWGWWGGGIVGGVIDIYLISGVSVGVKVIQCFSGSLIVVIKDAIRSMRHFGFH